MIKHLLPQCKNYYKTALHVHTTVSDGSWTPEKLKACFKENGFHAVAFSDHHLITSQSNLNDDDFIALTSYEMGFCENDISGYYRRLIHINVLSKEPDHLWQAANPPSLFPNSHQYIDKVDIVDKDYPFDIGEINDFIAQTNQHGFLCTYNHPDCIMIQHNEDMDLEGLWGIELYNYDSNLCGTPSYNDEKFQKFLLQGKRVFPVMGDDAHSKNGFRGSCVWVGAKELTYGNILNGLEKGDFYCTNGPQIHSLTLDDDNALQIDCSEVMQICLLTHSNFKRMLPFCGKGAPITQAQFDLTPWFESIISPEWENKAFFRLVLIDDKGNRAYTRAYWYDEFK